MTAHERAEYWVDEYGDLLFRFAMSRTSDSAVSEDLVQDTLLSAFNSLDTFKGEASDKTWLMRILRNKIIDYYRKTRTRQGEDETSMKRETSLSPLFDDSGGWNRDHAPHAWPKEPDEAMEHGQMAAALHQCIGKLSGKGGDAFQMKYIEDLDSADICKVLEITPSNYWVLIHRAKLQLRECLDHNYFDELRKHNAE